MFLYFKIVIFGPFVAPTTSAVTEAFARLRAAFEELSQSAEGVLAITGPAERVHVWGVPYVPASFAMPVDRIKVVIHPQSMVHSMVEYEDGSILAQLGQPYMRTPIAYGLGFPERIDSGVGLLALTALGRLDFEEPNFERFPCLRLSFNALETGQAACVTLNAANEIAVDCFLKQQIRYTEIAHVIETCLDRMTGQPTPGLDSLDEVLALDARSRSIASELCLARS